MNITERRLSWFSNLELKLNETIEKYIQIEKGPHYVHIDGWNICPQNRIVYVEGHYHWSRGDEEYWTCHIPFSIFLDPDGLENFKLKKLKEKEEKLLQEQLELAEINKQRQLEEYETWKRLSIKFGDKSNEPN